MARVLYILGLIALLLQATPVRSCVLQAMVSDVSCHDLVPLAVAGEAACADRDGLDGCVPDAVPHDTACVCELPKFTSVEKVVALPARVMTSASTAEWLFLAAPASSWWPALDVLAAESPPLARSLPLLT